MSTWAKVEFALEVGGSAAAEAARFVEPWYTPYVYICHPYN